MAKIIDILINAKNQTTQAVGSAQKGILGLAESFLKSKASIVMAWGAVVAKVAEGALKLVALYDEDARAVRRLTVAHQLFGDSANNFVKAEIKMAGAIQDEIGKGDEATIALMSRLRLYGVMPSALDKAAKATYALSAAGMGEEQAARAVALAMQGNYTMLNRYIPALRNATTEEEKHQAFLKTVEVGYAMAKEDLNSYSGAITNLKGRLGDLGEVFGGIINHNNWLNKSITATADGIKWLTNEISGAWNGVDNAIDNTVDARQLEQDEKALKEVYRLNESIVAQKKMIAELSEKQIQLKAEEKALPALKEQAELLKEQLKLRKAIVNANAKDQVNDVKARKQQEKEAERMQKQNDKFMRQGQAIWERVQNHVGQRGIEAVQKGDFETLKKLGGLTENQLAKLEVFFNRAKAQAEIGGDGIIRRWNPNAGKQFDLLQPDKKFVAEGLQVMADRAEDHVKITEENIKDAKRDIEQLEELGSMEFLKKDLARLDAEFAKARSESNLYQKDIAHHTEKMASETADMKVYVEQANLILGGVETYIRKSLEAS